MGFNLAWVNLIMFCVTTMQYNVLDNGNLIGLIHPHWGLHEGGPISPYLFILWAEGLSRMIYSEIESGLLHGCKVMSTAPGILHIFFVDDNIFFFEKEVEDSRRLRSVLDCYVVLLVNTLTMQSP